MCAYVQACLCAHLSPSLYECVCTSSGMRASVRIIIECMSGVVCYTMNTQVM